MLLLAWNTKLFSRACLQSIPWRFCICLSVHPPIHPPTYLPIYRHSQCFLKIVSPFTVTSASNSMFVNYHPCNTRDGEGKGPALVASRKCLRGCHTRLTFVPHGIPLLSPPPDFFLSTFFQGSSIENRIFLQ